MTTLDEIPNVDKDTRELLGQNKLLKVQLQQVTDELEDASRELELYRAEPRSDALAYQGDIRFPKSRSVVELDAASADPVELQK